MEEGGKGGGERWGGRGEGTRAGPCKDWSGAQAEMREGGEGRGEKTA